MAITRTRLALALLVTAAAVAAAPAAHAEIVLDEIGGSTLSFEGLVQADANWFDNDLTDLNGAGNNGDDSEFELRRAEIVLKGKGPGNLDWVVGYDGKADKWLDVNARYKLGDGHFVQAGQYKQPNSLEELSSTKNNDFISKATVTNTFAVARRLGAAYGYGNNTWSVTASAFGRELTRNLASGSGYGARGTFAPINDDGRILHFGLSYVNYDTDADTLRLRARPQADLATVRLVDTGAFTDTDRIGTLGVESFYATGPLKLQGEYMRATVDRYGVGNDDFTGSSGYVSAIYNLTGESWGYKGGVPSTPRPDSADTGMWQAGLRYDTLDLDDGAAVGGQMDALTAGVNWYWRSNFKLMLNYVKVQTERRGVDDNPDIIEGRLQFFW